MSAREEEVGSVDEVEGTCTIPDCNRPIAVKRYGWCKAHHARWCRTGDPLPKSRPERGCSVGGCSKRHHAKGLCSGHYQDQLMETIARALCCVESCGKPMLNKKRGLCRAHYKQYLKTSPIAPKHIQQCVVDGCSKDQVAKERCRVHYTADRLQQRQEIGSSCEVQDCGRPLYTLVFCYPHHYRNQKYGDAAAGPEIRRPMLDAPPGMRWCSRCETIKDQGAFNARKRWCRECNVQWTYQYTAENHTEIMQRRRANYEAAKAEGRCADKSGWGCGKPAEPGFVHCREHRAEREERRRLVTRMLDLSYVERGIGGACWLCGGTFSVDDPRQHDHLIPSSLGGPDEPWNFAPAHASCNNRRRNSPLSRTILEWHPWGVAPSIAKAIEKAIEEEAAITQAIS